MECRVDEQSVGEEKSDRKMKSSLTNSTVHPNLWHLSVSPIFIVSVHTVNFFLGLPLNVYIIILLIPRNGVMDYSDVFSWNQAVAEMFFVLFGSFHSLCSVNLCFFEPLGFFLGTSLCSRCLFQCCVCLERYLAVVHPVTFLRYKPLRYRVACSIMAWMCSLAIGVACSCTFPYMPYSVFSVLYLLSLTVDVFCCLSILRRLKHPGPRGRESEEVEISAPKRKAFQVVSVNLLLFLIQTIPIAIAFGLHNALCVYDFGMAVTICMVVNSATGVLQPVFVLQKAGKLSGLWSLMKRMPSFTCYFRSGTRKSTQIAKGL
ncbi:hypothetical protein MHYP_G00355840 [Metynnis hypsauchen]